MQVGRYVLWVITAAAVTLSRMTLALSVVNLSIGLLDRINELINNYIYITKMSSSIYVFMYPSSWWSWWSPSPSIPDNPPQKRPTSPIKALLSWFSSRTMTTTSHHLSQPRTRTRINHVHSHSAIRADILVPSFAPDSTSCFGCQRRHTTLSQSRDRPLEYGLCCPSAQSLKCQWALLKRIDIHLFIISTFKLIAHKKGDVKNDMHDPEPTRKAAKQQRQ
jgi:hypothetical protein